MRAVAPSKKLCALGIASPILLAVMAAAPAQAEPITYSFTADVTSVTSVTGGLSSLNSAQTITGTFTYETTTAPRLGGTVSQSVFDAVTSLQVSILSDSNDVLYTAQIVLPVGQTATEEIQLYNFPPIQDSFVLVSRATSGLTGDDVNGLALQALLMVIFYNNNDQITDASVLPSLIPFNPAVDLVNFIAITFGTGGEEVLGILTSLQLQQTGAEVPEPSSLAIFTVLGAVLGGARCTRRRRNRA